MGKKGGGAVRIKQVGPKGSGIGKMPINPMEEFMIPPHEQIHLPPPPDRNMQFFWPMSKL